MIRGLSLLSRIPAREWKVKSTFPLGGRSRCPAEGKLLDVFRNQFGHLEHADLALAVEYRPERVIGVDHGSFFLILATILLNVVPEPFRQLSAREWS